MYACNIDGRHQVRAGVSLLEHSHLVKWDSNQLRFLPVSPNDFGDSWHKIDPEFGRFICWINFSAGAEMLAKGVCLLHEVEIRSSKYVPAYPDPSEDLTAWATKYMKDKKSLKDMEDKKSFRTIETVDYGTLGNLIDKPYPKIKESPALPPALPRLFEQVGARAAQSDQYLILAAYSILADTIRNRDAHAYVPNVRDSHFSLVSPLFIKCFNILVSWLPDSPGIFAP